MMRFTAPDSQRTHQREPSHGVRTLPGVVVGSYSLEIEDESGMVGDQASQTAFRSLLTAWRERLEVAGRDPLGSTPTEELSKADLDRMAREGDSEAQRTIALAVAEFADRLAEVIARFMRQPAWQGVQRIVIGGGFKESEIGRLAIRETAQRLVALGTPIDLSPIHHGADVAGLIGWGHLAPTFRSAHRRAILAVDIGGTNVRCGIVAPADEAGGEIGEIQGGIHVAKRDFWCHADDAPTRKGLVDGIVAMLRRLAVHADRHGVVLAPFIGVSCPGIIRHDGFIDRGAHNLPGDWHGAGFHLPHALQQGYGGTNGMETIVAMHNDAVVQGLSEIPFLHDVKRWAVLTIGTGLGNASYTKLG